MGILELAIAYFTPFFFSDLVHLSRPGRPSHLDLLEDLAIAMWAPVFKTLSDEDKSNLSRLPYDESLYPIHTKDTEVLAKFRVEIPRFAASDEIRWIESERVDKIHDRLIQAYGGHAGVRHPGWVSGFIERARNSVVMNHDTLPTIFHKAGHLMREICVQHPYLDGQKRTGLAAAFILLGLNGYALWSRNQTQEVHYAMKVAQGEFDTDAIAKWLRQRVGPLRLEDGNSNIVSVLGGPSKPVRCWKCGHFMAPTRNFAFCRSCKFVYELRARAVALAIGPKGRHIDSRIGVHKIGEGLKTKANRDSTEYSFAITDPAVFNFKPELKAGQRVRIVLPRWKQQTLVDQ